MVGGLFGLADADMPATIEDFDAYWHDMLRSDDLHVSPQARDLAKRIVFRPPVPPAAVPLRELVNQTTIGLLPPTLRWQYRLPWDPVRAAAVHGGAEWIRRLLMPLAPERLRLVPQARGAASG